MLEFNTPVVKLLSGIKFLIGKVKTWRFPVLCPTEFSHSRLVVVDAFLKLQTQFSLFLFHNQMWKNSSKKVGSLLIGYRPDPSWSVLRFSDSLISKVNGTAKRMLELVDKWFVAIRETDVNYVGTRFQSSNRNMPIGIHCSCCVRGVHVRKYVLFNAETQMI
jgi:hypothetical protein